MEKDTAGIYVHIPFCTGVCSYCHYARVSNMPQMVDAYLDSVKKELSIHKKLGGEVTADSLYLGGGTPTYLNETQMTEFLERMGQNVNAAEDIEVTVESSPETLSREKLRALKTAGVNRLSIGVQAFDDHLLAKVCKRRHNERMAAYAVREAAKTGFQNGVNIDLIYGLPDQTPGSWARTLDTTEELSPEYVTVYHLRVKKGTQVSQMPPERFPSEYNTWLMYVTAVERLTGLGYVQISPNQFAKKGRVFRHQENKWGNKPLLGLGVSAYGYVNYTVYHNLRSIEDYGNTVHKGHLPVYVGKKLTKEEQMTRAVIFGLKKSGVNRRDGGLNKSWFKETYGISVEDAHGKTIGRLRELGLVDATGRFIKLTYKGILLSDEVCREFYTPQEKEHLKQIGQAYGRGVF